MGSPREPGGQHKPTLATAKKMTALACAAARGLGQKKKQHHLGGTSIHLGGFSNSRGAVRSNPSLTQNRRVLSKLENALPTNKVKVTPQYDKIHTPTRVGAHARCTACIEINDIKKQRK